MKFNSWSIGGFNSVMGTRLKTNMTFEQAIDEIDNKKVFYFYVSLDPKDVIKAIQNEKDEAEMLDLRLINIEDLGIYIAI